MSTETYICRETRRGFAGLVRATDATAAQAIFSSRYRVPEKNITVERHPTPVQPSYRPIFFIMSALTGIGSVLFLIATGQPLFFAIAIAAALTCWVTTKLKGGKSS